MIIITNVCVGGSGINYRRSTKLEIAEAKPRTHGTDALLVDFVSEVMLSTGCRSGRGSAHAGGARWRVSIKDP